ncbi:MAG: hypothetical protein SFZ23_11835 [Planctomycetota bacterium]|nr:hypothetical protein [Planctomycetota bacterium]
MSKHPRFTHATLLTLIAASPIASAVRAAPPSLTPILTPSGEVAGAYPSVITGDGAIVFGTLASGGVFAWTADNGSTSVPILPGWSNIRLAGVSSNNSILVGTVETAGGERPVRWVNRVPETLDTGGRPGRALGVSADGTIIVGSIDIQGVERAWFWGYGDPLGIDSGFWTTSRATDASASGERIVGLFQSPQTGSDWQIFSLNRQAELQIIDLPTDTEWPPRPFYALGGAPVLVTDDGRSLLANLSCSSTCVAPRAFKYTYETGAWSLLPSTLYESTAGQINASGSAAVGFMQFSRQDFRGAIWTTDTGWFEVAQFLVDHALPRLNDPMFLGSISNDASLVPLYTGYGDESRAYLLNLGSVCRADLDDDNDVDFGDYLLFVEAWATEQPLGDWNRNSVVDFFDYLEFVADYDDQC